MVDARERDENKKTRETNTNFHAVLLLFFIYYIFLYPLPHPPSCDTLHIDLLFFNVQPESVDGETKAYFRGRELRGAKVSGVPESGVSFHVLRSDKVRTSFPPQIAHQFHFIALFYPHLFFLGNDQYFYPHHPSFSISCITTFFFFFFSRVFFFSFIHIFISSS